MEYITILLCVVALIVIAINVYLIVDFYKQDVKAKELNDKYAETIEEIRFKNNLRSQKWD